MFSLCITNYERTDLLFQSFEKVLDDPLLAEIIISDDCSSKENFKIVKDYCKDLPKVVLLRNKENLGMSRNKMVAIERAKMDYCIIFDSDNVITPEYLKILSVFNRYPNVINMPSSGGDGLDFSRLSNWYISKANVKKALKYPEAAMMLNTCNYCVHRESYLKTYEYDASVLGSDTVWFNYLWLKKGGAFVVVPDLTYFHRVHTASGFMKHLEYNTQMCKTTIGLIELL